MEIFKYQLEISTKCDKLIEQNSEVINQNNQLLDQNNQIIELLQKIADK